MTDELHRKVDRSVKLIQAACKVAKEHGQQLEICYSGGKDSDVILELAKMSGVDYRAIYKNTTIDPPGTIAHVKANGVEILQPKMTFAQLMAKKGFPSRVARFCCQVLKEYKVLDYAVIGVRRDESRARAERYKEPEQCRVYSAKEKCRQYMPLLDWTERDVADFITERGIKCHHFYYDEDGTFHPERRLGCMGCPIASRRKRVLQLKEYPNMIKMYCRQGEKYRQAHPNSPNIKMFPTVYDWLTFTLYCDSIEDFRQKFGVNMFGEAIDTKAFLEKEFNIKL
jgi:phosphoadenosine phosphosulfate reductase